MEKKRRSGAKKRTDAARFRNRGGKDGGMPAQAGMALRARRAALVLGAFVLAFALSVVFAKPAEMAESAIAGTDPPASDKGAGGEGRPVGDGGQPSPESLAALILAGDAQGALARAGSATGHIRYGCTGADVLCPEGFEEEVLALSGMADVLVEPDVGAVGFCVPGMARDAFSLVSEELRLRGWTAVASGTDNGGSFFKEEGRYRWLFVMCYQVGETVSVVLQYR